MDRFGGLASCSPDLRVFALSYAVNLVCAKLRPTEPLTTASNLTLRAALYRRPFRHLRS